MHTTQSLKICRSGLSLLAKPWALPAILALAAFASPNLASAQAPTFNTLVTTYKGDPNWAHPGGAAVGDFNGDGKLDSAVFDGTSTVHMLLGHGDGTFAEHRVDVPLITASNAVGLNPAFAPYLPHPIDGVIRAIKAVDVNGDGKLDVVCLFVTHINFAPLWGTTVLINAGNDANGVPQFTTATHYFSLAADVRSLTIGDLNGDGKPDFIVGSAYGYLEVYLNNGDGTFTFNNYTTIQPNVGGAVGFGAIADLNGDGKADFIVTDGQATATDIFFGNGDGTFQAPVVISNSAGSIAVADLNNDGKPDFVEAYADGTVAVFLNNGNGTFGSPTKYPPWTGGVASAVAIADMNGDGNLDLVATNDASTNGTNGVAVLLGNGDGTFGAPNHYNVNARPVDLAVVDFNGDGKPDIGTVGFNDDTYGVLTNTTPFGPPPATLPVIFTRTTATAEGWKKYTVTFIPTQSGNYTLGFNLLAGGPSGDNSILIDAVKITTGTTTVFSDGFETPALASNTGVSANGGAATLGNWACSNYSGILNGSPPNWGLDAQGLGTADGTSQYAYLQAVFGTLGKIKAVNTLALVAGQTYTVTFYQASRLYFGGQVTYNVTIDQVPNDTTPPVITAPSSITKEATSASGAAVTFTATANDDVDGAVTVVADPASGSTFPLGTSSVSLSATDAAGNTAHASIVVTVQDTTAPVVTAPANVVAEATSANGASVTYPAATATDAVGVAAITYSQNSGTQFPLGTTNVNITAKDAAGNAGTGSFTVTVRDTTAPALTVPASQTLEATSAAGAVATFAATATDAVTASPTITYSAASGSTFPLGTTTVTVTAKDAAGNSSAKLFTITVRDTTAPAVTASLVTVKGGGDDESSQRFTVVFSAKDAVGVKTLTATLNGVTVTNGQVVQLQVIKSGAQRVKRDDDKLQIKATSFLLTVTATDAAGNKGTATAAPVFNKNGKDDDDKKGNNGDNKDDGKKGG